MEFKSLKVLVVLTDQSDDTYTREIDLIEQIKQNKNFDLKNAFHGCSVDIKDIHWSISSPIID